MKKENEEKFDLKVLIKFLKKTKKGEYAAITVIDDSFLRFPQERETEVISDQEYFYSLK